MNQANENLEDVKHMEAEAKYKIITLEDEDGATSSSQRIKILTDCKAAINHLYEEFRDWLKENQESEEVQMRKEKLKAESEQLIQAAKMQLGKLQENETLKGALNKGVQVASDTGSWLLHSLNDGVDTLRNSQGGQKVEQAVQTFKQDERVKQKVASWKKGTLKLAESAFEGLKKVLDDENEQTIKKESETEVCKNEKNNNL